MAVVDPIVLQSGVSLDLQAILLLLAVAFVPPILFAAAVAGAKRYRKEPMYALRRTFLWGALGAAFIALVVNTMVTGVWARPYFATETGLMLLTALVVAPVVEETAKGVGLGFVREENDEVADGLIYGAVIGLGFAATENLFYEAGALIQEGQAAWFWTAVGRTFSSTFLHATASAMVGYGVARARVGKGSVFGVIAWWFGAVGLHAAFNFFATFGAVFGILGLLPLVVFAIWAFGRVRSRVTELSLVAPHARWERVGRHQELEADEVDDEDIGWVLVDQDTNSTRWSVRHDRGLDDRSENAEGRAAASDDADGKGRGEDRDDEPVETWYPERDA